MIETNTATIGMALVVAACTFNLLLCYIQTRHWLQIANTEIIACELAIILFAFILVRDRVTPRVMRVIGVLTLFLIGGKLINPGLDFKILHDLAIIYVFYQLGAITDQAIGARVLWLTMIILLIFSAFELMLPTVFSQWFDVWGYYVNKGVIAQDTTNYSDSNLFISGNRGGAASRTFLPSVFGSHRVSSIFLEPDSVGNFSAIAFAWSVSTAIGGRLNRAVLTALALFCFVLADSRFASGCCMLMLLLRVTPLHRSRFVVFILPVLVVTALTVVGSIHALPGVRPGITDDNLSGRLLFSGRLLDYWNLQQWLALAQSQVYTADTGYAYAINNLGLPFALCLWAIFAIQPPRTPEAAAMKAMISVYFATSLCVGASIFTIKTSALLWFLYGATTVRPGEGAAAAPAKSATA